ncbi:MAG: hypothetical protein LBV16_06040 [Elusimicrobiota bacterium]|jgi:hypothetical protein|nr:hypothetical protein [Elusimicrobiota bacterium]
MIRYLPRKQKLNNIVIIGFGFIIASFDFIIADFGFSIAVFDFVIADFGFSIAIFDFVIAGLTRNLRRFFLPSFPSVSIGNPL